MDSLLARCSAVNPAPVDKTTGNEGSETGTEGSGADNEGSETDTPRPDNEGSGAPQLRYTEHGLYPPARHLKTPIVLHKGSFKYVVMRLTFSHISSPHITKQRHSLSVSLSE